MFSSVPANVQAIALTWQDWDYFYDGGWYADPYWGYPFTVETDIPISDLTNGVYLVPDSMTTNGIPVPGQAAIGKVAVVQPIAANGQRGYEVLAGFLPFDAPCFVDGRQHLKQNLLFELRAATESQPCESVTDNGAFVPADTNYVESSIFHWSVMFHAYNTMYAPYIKMDDLWPFTVNYELHQRLYNPNYSGPSSFVWQTNLATVPASAVLGISDPYWISQGLGNPPDVGADTNGGALSLASGIQNLFGLTFSTALVNKGYYYYDPGSGHTVWHPIITVAPGNLVAMSDVSCFYSQTADPTLNLADYYFAVVNTPGTFLVGLITPYQDNPIPTYTGFANSNHTGMLITSVGTPTVVGGWAKFSIQNGSSSKFAYLGQYYLTNAFVVTNGVVTANTTGIVSPYGDFFPTQPGTVAMITMPDTDYQQGTGIVHVVSLNVDANHDGTMDFTYNSPDYVSPNKPFRFWAADDDRSGDFGGDGIPGQVYPKADGVSYAYLNNFQPVYTVLGRRHLEDFFPVYLNIGSLFQSNALSAGISATDTNYQFVLSQADGALRFAYTDLTPTNYMNFLQDTNESGNLASAPLTTITPNGVALTNTFIGGIATNNQGIILVEAWTNTTQPLMLTIYHGTNQIAQTQLYLSISGIEQMFRQKNLIRALHITSTVGWPDRLTDADVPNEPDTIDKNFVFLHGYNVNPNQARGVFADTFKRMYWSGSHAKFYSVTWDGYDSQDLTFGLLATDYHTNVCNAIATAPALGDFLNSLTNGTKVVAAHSLGNMVVLSALSDWNTPVDKYFMLDAAVAIEAIQGNATQSTNMIHPEWNPYTNRVWASEWHNLFPTNDYRNALTWRDRFQNLPLANMYNFYSSGEEVLREHHCHRPLISAILFCGSLAG